MEQLTASEVVGELRRMSRMYEVFKRAEEMVMVLANLETNENTLKKSIQASQEKLETVEKTIQNTEMGFKLREQEAQKFLQKMQDEAMAIRNQASDKLKDARNEAASLVSNAKEQVQGMQSQVMDLRKTIATLNQEATSAKIALESILQNMQSKKMELLKAFN